MKRTLIVCLVGLLVIPGSLLSFTSQAHAEDYPSKDIRLIIGGVAIADYRKQTRGRAQDRHYDGLQCEAGWVHHRDAHDAGIVLPPDV